MKICFAVCEYNPFHNGHAYHLQYIRENIRPDYLVIVMSGNFVQRGDIAVCDKYARATWAIKAGADAVIELPTVFATANAEIFAKGAIKLVDAISGERSLCFGSESGDKKTFLATASALLDESKEFKRLFKEELKTGTTTIKAKCSALEKMGIENLDFNLLKSPNNILGVEYAKAILNRGGKIEICPIKRQGRGYDDLTLEKGLSSASAIRAAVADGKFKKTKATMPSFVYKDLPKNLPSADDLIFYSALKTSKKQFAEILDCSEGLENRIKALTRDCENLECLKTKLKTKRYTYSRLSRILLSAALGIDKQTVERCLSSELYLKILAIDKNKTELLSYLEKNSAFPIIARKSDADKLSGVAKECFQRDVFALSVYDFVAKTKTNEYEMKLV